MTKIILLINNPTNHPSNNNTKKINKAKILKTLLCSTIKTKILMMNLILRIVRLDQMMTEIELFAGDISECFSMWIPIFDMRMYVHSVLYQHPLRICKSWY